MEGGPQCPRGRGSQARWREVGARPRSQERTPGWGRKKEGTLLEPKML